MITFDLFQNNALLKLLIFPEYITWKTGYLPVPSSQPLKLEVRNRPKISESVLHRLGGTLRLF